MKLNEIKWALYDNKCGDVAYDYERPLIYDSEEAARHARQALIKALKTRRKVSKDNKATMIGYNLKQLQALEVIKIKTIRVDD